MPSQDAATIKAQVDASIASQAANKQAAGQAGAQAVGNGINVSMLLAILVSVSPGLATGIALATNGMDRARAGMLYPELYRRGDMLKAGMNWILERYNLPVRMVGNSTRPILKDTRPNG
jgi:uncharacterized membrane protein